MKFQTNKGILDIFMNGPLKAFLEEFVDKFNNEYLENDIKIDFEKSRKALFKDFLKEHLEAIYVEISAHIIGLLMEECSNIFKA